MVRKETVVPVLALLTSTGTLLCCALPAVLAALAGGAAVGALIAAVPWLVPLSRHKGWVFLTAGVFIVLSGFLTLRPQGRVACALTGGRGCEVAGRWTRRVFWTAVAIYLVGAFFAYGLAAVF